jgi:hypothetical protein
LIEALEVCGKIEGIGVVQFGEKDVVRHNLVQQIIRAYEEWDMAHPQRGGNANAGRSATRMEFTASEAVEELPREVRETPGREASKG